MSEVGPVQLVAIGFPPDARFEGRIMEELAKLERVGTVRILDLLFVRKDPDSGDVVVLDVQGDDLGGIVGALLGFGFEGTDGSAPAAVPSGDAHAFGLTQDDIEDVAAGLDPGHAAGFLLVEHLWARDFKRAAEDAGGTLLGEGFLTPQAIAEVAPELAGMAEALDEVEAEEGS
jgi:uncharacterized membrane protein